MEFANTCYEDAIPGHQSKVGIAKSSEVIIRMDLFVARQPIFDRNRNLVGYELLHRESEKFNEYSSADGEYATSRVITSAFLSMGLDSLTNGKLAFINFTASLLKSGVANLLPKDQLVIEIMETVAPTKDILNTCQQLKQNGYRLALDDYVLAPVFEPMTKLADIIKVDFRQLSLDDQYRSIQMNRHKGIEFLAEKIETEEEFNRAKEMGYGLFQGYFFAKPMILKTKTIVASKLGHIRLMQAVNSTDPDIRAIVSAIESDVKLSMETIKLSNSAYYGRLQRISSLRQAVVALGLDGIRRWIYLASLRRLGIGKPEALVTTSIIRAKFMELLGPMMGRADKSSEYSLLGLFSLLDALTGCPFEELLPAMNIDEEIIAILTGVAQDTSMAQALHLIQSYEQGQWQEANQASAKLGVSLGQVATAYYESLKWYYELVNASHSV